MTKLNVMDAIGGLEETCTKVKYVADDLANKHFSTDDITENINLMIFQFPMHQTLYMILHDYIVQLQRQICELEVDLKEGGIEI